jgi:hypothetical protein
MFHSYFIFGDPAISNVGRRPGRVSLARPPAPGAYHVRQLLQPSEGVKQVATGNWCVPVVGVFLRFGRGYEVTVAKVDDGSVVTGVVRHDFHACGASSLLMSRATIAAPAAVRQLANHDAAGWLYDPSPTLPLATSCL